MYERGLYTLSGDPVHYGHLYVIQQAAPQCKELVVCVMDSEGKRASCLFSLNARRRLLKGALGNTLPNVQVITNDELLVDVFLREGCDVLFRGIRDERDQEFEEQQLAYHEMLLPGIRERTVFIQSGAELGHISSSLVKAFAWQHVDVSDMVPPVVKAALEFTMHGQCFVGITGCTAVGKTHVAQELCRRLQERGYEATLVEIEGQMRAFLEENSPGAQRVMGLIRQLLLGPDSSLDLKEMARALASADPAVAAEVQAAIHPHMGRLLRQAVRGKKGFIFFVATRLVENGGLPLVNNRVIIVDSLDHAEMCATRGISQGFSKHLSGTTAEKVVGAQQEISRTGYGRLIQCNNRLNQPVDGAVLDQLISILPQGGST